MNPLEKALRTAGKSKSRSRRRGRGGGSAGGSPLGDALARVTGGASSGSSRTQRRVQRQSDVTESAEAWDRLYTEWERSQIVYEGDNAEAHATLEGAGREIDAILDDEGESDHQALELAQIVFFGPDDATTRGAIRTYLERMIEAWIIYHREAGSDKAELLASHHVLPSLTALAWKAEQLR